MHIVRRLAQMYPDRRIFPLNESICTDMGKIDLQSLWEVVQNPGTKNVIQVPVEVKSAAKIALQRMLEVAA